MIGLLIFHPTVAPYRIDFFNDLSRAFDARICLRYWNLRDQTFDYQKIYDRFDFQPVYLKEMFRWGERSVSGGYWKQLDRFQPELVLTEEFGMGTLSVLMHRFFKRKKYKVVALCDDSYDMVSSKNEFSWLHRMARKWIAPHLDDLILVEPKVQEWYQEHYGKGFCFPILQEDGYAREQFRKAVDRSLENRKRQMLTEQRVFLFVGRLVALKNVQTILRAFAHLDQQENVLVIIGDGTEKQNLMRLSEALHVNVRFMGRLEGEALNVWYNMADVLVLASFQEAFGAVTNEALLAGCYVLVSRKAGSACLVEEGINGYTFDPMDVESLAQRMKEVSFLPMNREADGLKPNRMRMSYRENMNGLVHHLQSLAHE